MRSYKAARRAAQRDAQALEPVPFEVTYFDADDQEHTETFQCTGEVSTATLTDLGYFADLQLETPEAAAIVRKIFMEAIGDDVEFKRFWKIAPQLDEDTLVAIMSGVIEDTAGRPTKRPSGSPAESSGTGQVSRAASSTEASAPVPSST